MRIAVLVAVLLLALVVPASAQGRSAADVVAAFQAANLPVFDVTVITEDDPDYLVGRPGHYVEKISWRDARVVDQRDRVTIESGGSLERFANARDYRDRLSWLDQTDRIAIFGTGGEYRYGDDAAFIILRIDRHLTPAQAAEYEGLFANR